jgi:predicted MFS family arabinose efflux permease
MPNTHSLQNHIAYWAVLLVSMMGAAVTTLMPLIVGAFSDSNLFTEQQIGLLSACDIAGILVASVSAYTWVRRCHWQWVCVVCLSVFIVANFATLSSLSFSLLALIRVIAGLACGACYSIALAALGDRPNSDKAFGDMVTIQVIFGTVGFAVLPYAIEMWSFEGIFYFFNLCLFVALGLALYCFPTNPKSAIQHSQVDTMQFSSVAMVFMGVVFYYFAQGTVWAYLERIGIDAGLSLSQVGTILAIGFAISALGSWFSGITVKTLGRSLSIWLTVVFQLICLGGILALNESNALYLYAIATIVYQIFWSFIVPIMMGIFNDTDKSGRLIVFCVSAFKVGLVLGPPAAGWILTYYSLDCIIFVGAISIFLSAVFLYKANLDLRAKQPCEATAQPC